MQIIIFLVTWYFWSTQNIAGLIVCGLLACYYCFQRLYEMYITVMALRKRREEGTLSGLDQVLGRICLVRGLVIDVIVNTYSSAVLWELPKWVRKEFLLTPRLKRLASLPKDSKGLKRYQRKVCRWLLGEIDQHDLSGGHDVPPEKK